MSAGATIPPRSPAAWAFMGHYFERFFRRHLNALRVARWGFPETGSGPVLVYSNHPAWWDAAVYILLARHLFPRHAAGHGRR